MNEVEPVSGGKISRTPVLGDHCNLINQEEVVLDYYHKSSINRKGHKVQIVVVEMSWMISLSVIDSQIEVSKMVLCRGANLEVVNFLDREEAIENDN